MRDGRNVDLDLRIGLCCSAKERRNLKTTVCCERQEVRRFHHWFRVPATVRTAQRNSDHSVRSRTHWGPLRNKRLNFSELISLEFVFRRPHAGMQSYF